MQTKRLLHVFVATAILLSIGLICCVVFRDKQELGGPPVSAFQDSRHIVYEIRNLPEIASLGSLAGGDYWRAYVRLADGLKITDTNLIYAALNDLSARRGRISSETSIKVMLLLRVCFECPPNVRQPAGYGGWISYSAQEAGRTNFDENWPVGVTSGQLYLQDNINGYLGQPYDPVADFRWRLINCSWRKSKRVTH